MLKAQTLKSFPKRATSKNVQFARFLGFTLAEVLITLGIIGIVAAMTIPTLVQNYNTRAWNTAYTVFTKKLEETLKTMNTQQTLAGHATTESFVEELSRHYKINKICSNDKLSDCFSDVVYWGGGEASPKEVDMSKVKTAKNFGQYDWNTNIVGVQFANGVNAMIAYNPLTSGDNACSQDPYSNEITGDNCLAILFDISGEKNPNTIGKDLYSNGNVRRLGSNCSFEIGGTCYEIVALKSTSHSWNNCSTEGTSTDPDDIAYMQKYGITYCSTLSSNKDYWAGAAEACGGTSRMVTESHLKELANFVYNGNPYEANVLSLGFKLNSNKYFYVWANTDYSRSYSYLGYFGPTGFGYSYFNRDLNYVSAVCLGD